MADPVSSPNDPSSDDLRHLTERELVHFADEARLKLAQELHSSIGQYVTGLSMLHRALLNALVRKELPEADQARREAEMLDQLGGELRRIMSALQPLGEEPEALHASLSDLAAAARAANGIGCEVRCEPDCVPAHYETRAQFYAIARALLESGAQRGDTRAVRIVVERHRLSISMDLADGSDLKEMLREISKDSSYRVSEVRAQVIGARLEITHTPPRGVVLTCALRESRPS
jgi:signal transduction histidine kinase